MLAISTPGTSVAQISATDVDASTGASYSHGKLSYSIISGDTNNEFQINTDTGLVSTAAVLNRETVASNPIKLVVKVRGLPDLNTREF